MKMTKGQWQKVGGIVFTALLAIAAVLGWFFPVEAPEARVRERISIDARDDAYMWNSADFYMYSDDHSTQKFHIDGATGNIDSEGDLNVAGSILSSSSGFTVTDSLMVDGQADAVQLTAQGYTTQTNNIFVVEQSDGTDVATVSNAGLLTLVGGLDVAGNVLSASGGFTVTDSLNVTGTVDFDSTFNVDGATTLVGNVTASAVVDVGTLLNLSPGTAEVVTAGSVIVPIASMQPITSATAVTCSTTSCITTTGFSAGDVLFLRNDNASDVITIDGTGGTVECKTDVALGAADILMLIFGGADWNCISSYDNS